MHSHIGSGSLKISRLGLGTASFAGINMVGAAHYHPPTEAEVAGLVKLAVRETPDDTALMVDTSAQYGRSETLLGRFLGGHPRLRERMYIATKWGLIFDPDDFCVYDYSIDNLRRSVAASAGQLGPIDLLYLHSNPGVPRAALNQILSGDSTAFSLMLDWRRSNEFGIRHIGISISTPEHIALLLERPDTLELLDVVQVNASLLLGNNYLAARMNQAAVSLVLNSPYRKGDAGLRDSPRGRRAIYHRILGRCPGSIVLTGTRDCGHFRENVGHVDSWAHEDALKLTYMSDALTPARAQEVTRDLHRYFVNLLWPPERSRDSTAACDNVRDRVDRIAGLFTGSRNTRLGPSPGAERRLRLRDRIAPMVRDHRPIEVVLTWAPRKFYARGAGNRVDLCELVALERLFDMHLAVRETYPEGLHYTIYYEDFEGAYIEQEPPSAFYGYRDSLENLVDILRLNATVSVVRTSDWIRIHDDPARVRDRLEENFTAIRNYWVESEHAGIHRSECLASYARMAQLGFTGRITQETRDHYLGRLNRLLGDQASPERKTEMVTRLFACVLLHRQLGMFDPDPRYQPVKVSFLRAAGGPTSIMDGRMDIRTIKASFTKRSLAPWSGRGYLRERRGRVVPAMKTWREALQLNDRLSPGVISLEHGAASLNLGADFLLP